MSTLNVTTIQNLSTLTASGQVSVGGNLLMNSGYGSAATAYGCRAWVNFNGNTATPSTIRGSGNVTSITKNGSGDYTINFTSALVDTNYAVSGSATNRNGVDWPHVVCLIPADSSGNPAIKSISQARIVTFNVYSPNAGGQDSADISVMFYR